ncbi:MAG: sulfatase [bacterium]|nr:sulfatase [bacterium]
MMRLLRGRLRRAVRLYAIAAACMAALLIAHARIRDWRTFRPNVILITADSMRADHLGCYGYLRATSPDIDRLASEGVLFENAVTPGLWTMPSLPSLMTSTHPRVHKVMLVDKKLPPRLPLLAELVQGGGFETAAFVNHQWVGAEGQGLDRGFRYFDNSYSAGHGHSPELHHLGDAAATDDLIAWLDKNMGKRVFAWIHYVNPHYPYTPPPPYDDMFEDDGLYRTGAWAPISPTPFLFGFIYENTARHMRRPHDVDHYVSQYDGEIRFVNDQIRRITRHLDATDMRRRTIMIISTDHGESLGEHDWYFEHNKPFETVARVPLIMRGYGVPRGRRVDALVSLIDLAPTVLDMLELPVPPSFEGRSMRSLIRGKGRQIRSYEYGGDPWAQDFMRTERYKLVILRPFEENHAYFGIERRRRGILRSIARMLRLDRSEDEEEVVEIVRLHDLLEDPGEKVDLSSEKPDIVSDLRSLLRHHNKIDEQKARMLRDVSGETITLDAKTTDFLKALGYIQ